MTASDLVVGNIYEGGEGNPRGKRRISRINTSNVWFMPVMKNGRDGCLAGQNTAGFLRWCNQAERQETAFAHSVATAVDPETEGKNIPSNKAQTYRSIPEEFKAVLWTGRNLDEVRKVFPGLGLEYMRDRGFIFGQYIYVKNGEEGRVYSENAGWFEKHRERKETAAAQNPACAQEQANAAIRREGELAGMRKALEAVRGESAKLTHFSGLLKAGYVCGLDDAKAAILAKMEEVKETTNAK